MWGMCFLAITVSQLSTVTGLSPPFPPLLTNNTSCAATSCLSDSACRIVFNPRTSSVSPKCINHRDLPQDNRQCGIAGGPLLTEITWGHGGLTKSTFLTLRCKRICPAGLVCTNRVCCAAVPASRQSSCPPSLPGNPAACLTECSSSASCGAGELCCPTSCGGSVCHAQDPAPPTTCAGFNCSEGLACVDFTGTAECVPRDFIKPHLCAAPGVCTPLPNSECVDSCQFDTDCPGKFKCCTTCSQCKVCDYYFIPSCNDVICPSQTPFCVDGPSCVERSAIPDPSTPKSGRCPEAISADLSACDEACARDSECPGTDKCCATGCGGAVCSPRVILETCAELVCPSDLQCVDEGPEGARCIPLDQPLGPSIFPFPDPKRGKCPASGGVCSSACTTDNECGLDQTCCPDVCGGNSCTAPEPEITCANADCIPGKTCVETSNGPTCIGPDAKPGTCPVFSCPVPPPPYPLPSVCQSECFNDFDCGRDNKCCVVCSGCRQCFISTESLCGKPCPPGHRCTDTGLRCIRAPCPGVYKCLPVEPCSLPPDVGPCDAALKRYYYYATGPKPGCRTFTYGGCGGNNNNFRTLRECLTACVGWRYD